MNKIIKLKQKYKDCNGEIINYGDILKCKFMEEQTKQEYSPKAPFCMLVRYNDTKDLVYISGMDDFQEVSEFQMKEDKKDNIISSLEIFANKSVYEANLNYFTDGEE